MVEFIISDNVLRCEVVGDAISCWMNGTKYEFDSADELYTFTQHISPKAFTEDRKRNDKLPPNEWIQKLENDLANYIKENKRLESEILKLEDVVNNQRFTIATDKLYIKYMLHAAKSYGVFWLMELPRKFFNLPKSWKYLNWKGYKRYNR